ncbi:MAG: hypothetical protein ACI4QM_02825, partial [Alphaproteobacteria bacterium]
MSKKFLMTTAVVALSVTVSAGAYASVEVNTTSGTTANVATADDLTAVSTQVSDLGTKVSGLETRVGTGDLDTTADNLSGAVNELNGKANTNAA